MPKVAARYLEVDPWRVIEKGFHPDRGRVSESIFSLGNEYMGVRGFFEEGYGGPSLIGSFFNGVFDEADIGHPQLFKGLVTEMTFIVNAVNWLYTRIWLGGEQTRPVPLAVLGLRACAGPEDRHAHAANSSGRRARARGFA